MVPRTPSDTAGRGFTSRGGSIETAKTGGGLRKGLN